MIDSRRKKVIVYDDSDAFQIIVIVEIWMRRTISDSYIIKVQKRTRLCR